MPIAAAGACLVLDDDALLEKFFHGDGRRPSGEIGDAAWRKRHDHDDRTRRIGVLGEHRSRQKRQGDRRDPLKHVFLRRKSSYVCTIIVAEKAGVKRRGRSAIR